MQLVEANKLFTEEIKNVLVRTILSCEDEPKYMNVFEIYRMKALDSILYYKNRIVESFEPFFQKDYEERYSPVQDQRWEVYDLTLYTQSGYFDEIIFTFFSKSFSRLILTVLAKKIFKIFLFFAKYSDLFLTDY
jgi:uncharacterized protein YxeA